ncbi:hypothetical protein Bca4012_027576 [Brassica carinata]
METSQEQSFLNPTTNLAEDPILRLSSSSSSFIHMGNKSFTEIDYFKLGELTFPQPPSPRHETNQGEGGVVEEAKTLVDIGKKAAETDKAYRTSKDAQQKAVASIRDVIMANEAAYKKTTTKPIN